MGTCRAPDGSTTQSCWYHAGTRSAHSTRPRPRHSEVVGDAQVQKRGGVFEPVHIDMIDRNPPAYSLINTNVGLDIAAGSTPVLWQLPCEKCFTGTQRSDKANQDSRPGE